MKTFTLFTVLVILLLPIQMFAQAKNILELRAGSVIQERILSKSIPNEQGRQQLETVIARDKISRTIVNEIILDNGFLLVESIFEQWDGTAWVNNQKNTFTYDGNNNLIEVLIQTWISSAWENWFQHYLTYDENNNLVEWLIQDWDGTNWVNLGKRTYSYDGNNNMIEELEQHWDDSQWNNFRLTSYTYDGSNNLIESIQQWWPVSNWENLRKYNYTYDANNNRIEELEQTWDGSNWVNQWRTTNSYLPITGIAQIEQAVNIYSLSNNYPNPFNPTTKISYTIPERGYVSLKIFNVLGSEVAELVKGEVEAGSYIIEFNASTLPSGIYFYKLQAGSFVETKKMVLMK